MAKYVFLPPIDDEVRDWARRLADGLPDFDVVLAEDDAAAARELVDADGAYGWVPPEVLPTVERLRLLQNPHAGPPTGWYYPELIDHPVAVSNPRGIYSDHIAQHILMFMLALSRAGSNPVSHSNQEFARGPRSNASEADRGGQRLRVGCSPPSRQAIIASATRFVSC
jgi:phosphoglycerate dehydrogenase-like enzyme